MDVNLMRLLKTLYYTLIFLVVLSLVLTPFIKAEEEKTIVLLEGLEVPYGVAVDDAGNLYFVEFVSGTLKKLAQGENKPITLLENLTYPYAVAVNKNGDIYFTEKTGTLKRLPANQTEPVLVASELGRVYGLTLNSEGEVYILGFGSPLGDGTGTLKKLNSEISILLEGLDHPVGIAVDSKGNVFFTEFRAESGTLKVLLKDGSLKTLLSDLTTPTGVAVDEKDNIYFAESSLGTVKKLSADLRGVEVIAENLTSPWGLASDKKGNLYVTAKTVNGTLTKIKLEEKWFNMVTVSVLGVVVGLGVVTVFVLAVKRKARSKTGLAKTSTQIRLTSLNF